MHITKDSVAFCKVKSSKSREQNKFKRETLMFIVALFIFPVAQIVKNLPTMQETWVRSLDQEDSLEKEVAAHSSILAWRSPWTEEAGGIPSSWGCKESHD